MTAEQVAAAVASGCVFVPASPAAVQRLAMQRKVFYVDGQPMLAGQGDGLFETVGTLMQLIEQGRQVLAYHAVSAAAEAPAAAEAAEPAPITDDPAEAAAPAEAESVAPAAEAPTTIAEAPAVKRRRAAPRRPPLAPASAGAEAAAPAEATSAPADAALDITDAVQARMPGRRPGRNKPRWVTAGAERRGRRDNHWSSRQK